MAKDVELHRAIGRLEGSMEELHSKVDKINGSMNDHEKRITANETNIDWLTPKKVMLLFTGGGGLAGTIGVIIILLFKYLGV